MEQSRTDWLLRVYCAIWPKTAELASVLLLSAGINIVTSAAETRAVDWLLYGGGALVIGGCLLFGAAGRLEELYEAARRRSAQPEYEEKTLAQLALGIARSRRQAGDAVGAELVFFVASLVLLLISVAAFGLHFAGEGASRSSDEAARESVQSELRESRGPNN